MKGRIEELPSGLVKVIGWSVEDIIENISRQFGEGVVKACRGRAEVNKGFGRHFNDYFTKGFFRVHRLEYSYAEHGEIASWLAAEEKRTRLVREDDTRSLLFRFFDAPYWSSPEDIEVIAMYVMNQDFDKSVLHKDTIPGFAEFFWRDMPMVYSDETFALIGERTGCCLCKENVVVEKTWFRRYFNK